MAVEPAFAAHPSHTRCQTPSKDASQLSSRQASPSPYTASSPPPFPPDADVYIQRRHESNDGGNAEKRSSIDPRRFTSDLDNSLIGQIHTLRLELESKDTVLENLEDCLHQSKGENAQLSEDLSIQAAEARSLRKQMQLLENGTLSALGDIAKERDIAVESSIDMKKRLETSKKRMRSQEEDAEKVHTLWDEERQVWTDEKRNIERKVHIAEARVRTMVAELMAGGSTRMVQPGAADDRDDLMKQDHSAKANDSTGMHSPSRAASRLSTRSNEDSTNLKETFNFRTSTMSGLHELGGSQMSGLSLAEELQGKNDDEEGDDDEVNYGLRSPNALREEILLESGRYPGNQKARRIMGLSARHSQHLMDYINAPSKDILPRYIDTATQFSPPTSPHLQAQRNVAARGVSIELKGNEANKGQDIAPDSEAARKLAPQAHTALEVVTMVSTACQTIELLPTPRTSAQVTGSELAPVPAELVVSTSTQTSEDAALLSTSATTLPSPEPSEIPVIAIHPPGSRPSSSHTKVVLPPRTRNAGCQASFESPMTEMKSISVQTEEMRVEKRPVRVQSRLQPSQLSSQSTSRIVERRSRATQAIPPKLPRRNFRSPPPVLRNEPPPASPPLPGFEDPFPGNNDNGPLNDKQQSSPRRPVRSDSMFAGFDDATDEDDGAIIDDFSDDQPEDFVPVRKTLSKIKDSWKLVPQAKNWDSRLNLAPEETGSKGDVDLSESYAPVAKPLPKTTSKTFPIKSSGPPIFHLGPAKSKDIRRTALVSSGTTAHTARARSPSEPSVPGADSTTVAPPFPVPSRSSSRRIPLSASEGAASPSPYTTSFFTTRRAPTQLNPQAKQKKSLRKTRSAVAVSKHSDIHGPPPLPSVSTSSVRPVTPKTPQRSRNQFILPYPNETESVKQFANISRPRSHTGQASIEAPTEQTSVVDAIAQTMVGEWMWKYVRKRTSFGITENPQAEFESGKNGDNASNGGIRHKRWVWLAPYERAVIWSGKQPTSGPALLGKGGRKRMYIDQLVHTVD